MSDWRFRAACAGLPGDEFFPTGAWGAANDVAGAYQAAARVCVRCPVRLECLEAALDEEGPSSAGNRYGMRGGLTPGQRRAVYDSRVEAARLAELARRFGEAS